MQTFVKESRDLWQYLCSVTKPIVLYGMGNGAEKIMAVLKSYDIPLSAIFASDDFVRGHSFHGYRVLKYHEVCKEYQNFIVLVAFGTEKEDVMQNIARIAAEQELYVPDVPVIGDGLWNMDYFYEHEAEIEQAYYTFADACSQKVFADILNFKLSGKWHYLQSSASPLMQAYESILQLGGDEIFMDLGAYTGDTIEEFIKFAGSYEKIIAMEPDYKNFMKLQKRIAEKQYQNICCYNLGVWNKRDMLFFSALAGRNSSLNQKLGKEVAVESVDNILCGARATYIKMDVEGAEKEALLGAGETISRFQPKLLISAYHRNEDFFKLPALIKMLNPAYRIYLRRHPAIPAWNLNIYAI